ncbi:MAG: DUF3179 domain-containing protein [Rhodothermales bacterium]
MKTSLQTFTRTHLHTLTAVLLGLGIAACDSAIGGGDGLPAVAECSVPESAFQQGCNGKDCIPSLTNPDVVAASEVSYLDDDSRVIGIVLDGQPLAVPHGILWWHEIANLDRADVQVAVTYCPLTGSSLAFDRAVIGGSTFGISGLLFQNNLTMYDRTSGESLWPQMNRAAGCGPESGTALPAVPILEMTWAGWRSLHPQTRVISNETGFDRNYRRYPYGDYESLGNRRLLDSRTAIDERRPPKERVLGIPSGEGGIAFPFGALDATGEPFQVVEETSGGEVVVFWDKERQAAAAYQRALPDRTLSFTVQQGQIMDAETGSVWRIDGLATAGPLEGTRLEPIADAYVAFWFAWAAFQPETRLWQGGEGETS